MNDGNIYVDFNTPNSYYSEHVVQYDKQRASKILGDIDNYYLKGIKPISSPKFADDMRFSVNDKINVDGIERPVVNSEGRVIHPTKTGIINFWKWFGDSKVVDEQGRPLVVYHGTDAKFNTFDRRYTSGQMGFHFGDKNVAKGIYGEEQSPDYVMGVYLNLQNPLRLDDQGGWEGEVVVKAVNDNIGSTLNSSASDFKIRDAIQKCRA